MPRHRSVVEIAAMLMQFRNEFLVAARRLLPARFAHRFARAEEAAAAVEFALVAAPFLALLFAIIETALVFFAGQSLETAATDSGRFIMTGQAQNAGYASVGAFKTNVLCPVMGTGGLFNCDSVQVDVQTYNQFSDITGAPPITNGQLDTSKMGYVPGGPGSIVVGFGFITNGRSICRCSTTTWPISAMATGCWWRRRSSATNPTERKPVKRWRAMLMRMRKLLSRFGDDRRGVSAVEFALLAPVMITFYLGCVEISDGVAADRKVSLTAAALANLAAQTTSISTTDMTNILNAASAIIAPYDASKLAITVTC